MNATPGGIALIHRWESLRLAAYLDSGGLPTIGWGTTKYPDGRRVKMGDTCTADQADAWFRFDLGRTERDVDSLTRDDVTPRQFDALVSLTYNIGGGAYRGSTLRRLVNANPNDSGIRGQFMRWIYDDGVPVPGLKNRRQAEADHYFGVA